MEHKGVVVPSWFEAFAEDAVFLEMWEETMGFKTAQLAAELRGLMDGLLEVWAQEWPKLAWWARTYINIRLYLHRKVWQHEEHWRMRKSRRQWRRLKRRGEVT